MMFRHNGRNLLPNYRSVKGAVDFETALGGTKDDWIEFQNSIVQA